MANNVDMSLPVDGARQNRGANGRARDAADSKAEDANDRHERQSDGDHNHCLGDRGAEWRFGITSCPEIALAGDQHRRVDDDREARQNESVSRR